MSGISLFVQDLSSFNPDRAKTLNQKIITATGRSIEGVYALVWPDYQPPSSPVPQANRQVFRWWRDQTQLSVWGWVNAQENQTADVLALRGLQQELAPNGWLLDIEGEWTKGAKLGTLISGAHATGLPVRASLAAASPSHVEYDYRTLDQHGVAVDWQAYFDSGEGCRPDYAIQQLYQPSFVIGGWEYRHAWPKSSNTYGWGKCGGVWNGRIQYDSFKVPGAQNASVKVTPAPGWGWAPVNHDLLQGEKPVGELLGRCRYALARVTLDVTRGAAAAHSLAEWEQIAGSARIPGSAKRPVSVYLAENAPDDVLVAIAKGAP